MATRAEIYEAIRNADKAGDSAGVRKLGEYLKTLPAEDTAPAPTLASTAEHQARLANAEADLAHEQSPMRGVGRVVDAAGDVLKGAGDVALTLGSQAVVTPIAGLAGAVAAPFGADRAANVVRGISDIAYQPKSDVGQQAMETIAKPFTWLAGKADKAGQVVSDVTGSPLLGAATNTIIQGAPAFLTKGARAPFSSAGRGVVNAVKRTTGGAAGADVAAANTAAAEAQSATAAAAKAQNYARTVGLDWDGLADSVKTKLTDIAKSSGDFSGLDPQALARFARLQSLDPPVPATRGQVTARPRATAQRGQRIGYRRRAHRFGTLILRLTTRCWLILSVSKVK
jgi:hypothetical protein